MDKFLRPGTLDIDPESSTAADEWDMWSSNFDAFFAAIDSALNPDKLALLRAHVSCHIFKLIKHVSSYDEAAKILKARFVKPKSGVYARHCLATQKQQAGETLDQFLDKLKSLAQDCDFKAASAEQVEELAIRDAFITGMSSNAIRQRLLENLELDLNTAVKQARALEMAQRHSEAYRNDSSLAAAPETAAARLVDESDDKNEDPELNAGVPGAQSDSFAKRCYFCGGPLHRRKVCRARDASCAKCGKIGHFAKVCRSAGNQKAAASVLAATNITLRSISHAVTMVTLQDKIEVEALVDTGSSRSFIRPQIAQSAGLKISPASGTVTLASSRQTSQIRGTCHCDLTMKDNKYENVTMYVMEDLCSPVLLGHDFLKQHRSVSVEFGGSQPPLELCGLAAAEVEPPTLFGNLTQDCRPIQMKSRRYSKEDDNFIREEVERLLEEGVIVPSRSPWRAQVVVVQQGSKKRLAIDYSQTINRFTNLHAYPVPAISDMTEKISKFSYFSTIDLKSAYHQIPLKTEERMYTAFEGAGRLYEFTRIPFGVKNGVACFQQILDEIIRCEDLQGTFAYVDDIIVCGHSKEEHDANLESFISAAEKYGLTINRQKSKFAQTRITTLGHVIEDHTISPDPERMKPLLEMQAPEDIRAKQRALGLLSHYAKWVPNFSEKVRPIVECSSFPMTKTALEAFNRLKHNISQASLHAIDDSAPFVVETDASAGALAASLTQKGKPVAFFSRSLAPSERHHSAIEREACAIVEAVRKWRHFLIGRHFQLVTDQQSVRFMFDHKNRGKVKNEKILRWRLELSCFSYDISYRPGSRNLVADALSRAPPNVSAAVGGVTSELQQLHDSLCHPGVTRMWHLVRCRNLPFSLEDVKSVIRKCATCAEVKPRFIKHSGILIKATRPFERLSVDFKGPLPAKRRRNRYILTVVDEYSRFVFAFPTEDTSAETTIQCLSSLFSMFGMPEYIHSDRGSAFTSAKYQQFLHARGVATSYSSAYNPRGNGQVERYNGALWRTIRLALHSRHLPPDEWEVVLPDALHSLRSLLCVSTNETPHERLFTFPRKASFGQAHPSWLLPEKQVLLRKSITASKYDQQMETVTLLHANPQYARVRHADGREATVSLSRLASPAQVVADDLLGGGDDCSGRSGTDLAQQGNSPGDGLRDSELGESGGAPDGGTESSGEPDAPVDVAPSRVLSGLESGGLSGAGVRPAQAEASVHAPRVYVSTDEATVRPERLADECLTNNDRVRRSSRSKRPPSYFKDYVTVVLGV